MCSITSSMLTATAGQAPTIRGYSWAEQTLACVKKACRELALLKENFVYPDVQKVYASPMLRCKQTAQFLYPGYLYGI